MKYGLFHYLCNPLSSFVLSTSALGLALIHQIGVSVLPPSRSFQHFLLPVRGALYFKPPSWFLSVYHMHTCFTNEACASANCLLIEFLADYHATSVRLQWPRRSKPREEPVAILDESRHLRLLSHFLLSYAYTLIHHYSADTGQDFLAGASAALGATLGTILGCGIDALAA